MMPSKQNQNLLKDMFIYHQVVQLFLEKTYDVNFQQNDFIIKNWVPNFWNQ